MKKTHPSKLLLVTVTLASLSMALPALADDTPVVEADVVPVQDINPVPMPEPLPPVVVDAPLPPPPVSPVVVVPVRLHRHRWVGMQLDIGAPDGLAAGVIVRPTDWLRTELAITTNTLAEGGRLGVTLDPINFGIAPTFTVEGGFMGQGTIPGHKTDQLAVGYDYVNLHLGLEFGNRQTWRFFIHAGPSYLHVNTNNFQSVVGDSLGGLTLANPTANVWFTPTAKLGFALYF